MEEKNYKLYRHILRKEVSGYKHDKYYYGVTKQKLTKRWQNGGGYRQSTFKTAINKFGWHNFEHEVLFDGLSEEEAFLLEEMYILLYNTRNIRHGFNESSGGKYGNHSNKTKKKISKANKGKYLGSHLTKERREKISKSNKGKKHSNETKNKIGKAHEGMKHSEESKKKMSKSHKGKGNKKVINLDTGEIFNSISEAMEKYPNCGTHISSVCKGKRKTAGGYHWTYYYEK